MVHLPSSPAFWLVVGMCLFLVELLITALLVRLCSRLANKGSPEDERITS